MSDKPLETVEEVIDALGGSAAVMALTGVRSPQAVSNWRRRKKIPPRHFAQMADALSVKNLAAPRRLWDMAPPDVSSA